MSALELLLVAVAGAAGAALRFLVDGLVRPRSGSGFSPGTTVVNVTGSFLLGLVTGLAGPALPAAWALTVGTGLLGGYTTFSAASLETVRLIQNGRPLVGLLHGAGMLLAAVLAAAAGLALGGLV